MVVPFRNKIEAKLGWKTEIKREHQMSWTVPVSPIYLIVPEKIHTPPVMAGVLEILREGGVEDPRNLGGVWTDVDWKWLNRGLFATKPITLNLFRLWGTFYINFVSVWEFKKFLHQSSQIVWLNSDIQMGWFRSGIKPIDQFLFCKLWLCLFMVWNVTVRIFLEIRWLFSHKNSLKGCFVLALKNHWRTLEKTFTFCK